MSEGLNSLERSSRAGPNMSAYDANYDKFQMNTAPMNVPNYKVADPNKIQDTYGNIQKNSHPDFKPVYGPQDNQRPINNMDTYKQNKGPDDQNYERLRKQAEETPIRGKEVKKKKPASPRRGRETPMKIEDVDDRFDSPKRETPSSSPKHKPGQQVDKEKQSPGRTIQPVRKPVENNYPASPQGRRYNMNPSTGPNIKPYEYKSAPVGPNIKQNDYNKATPVAPNIKPYNSDYDKKFPMKTNSLAVPDYKLNEGNKTYTKMQSASHPDFYPVYGPQDNKRDVIDIYKEPKEREKKPVEKTKETKEQKPVTKEEKISPREDKTKNTADRSPKKTDSPKETPKREQQKERVSPRKEDSRKQEGSPKREIPPDRKNINRREEKVPMESPRKKKDDNEEKYYGYDERPARNDKVEPDNNQVKFTPKDDKRDNKNQDNKDKEKETPRNKKDPYDDWVREKNKVNERKDDPHDYRRKEEEKKKTEAPKRDDPYSYKPRDGSTDKPPARVQPFREVPRKDANDRKTQDPRREVPYVRNREVRSMRADNPAFTGRDHVRPTKTQNNNTSIVRDAGNQKLDRRNKPTAKVLPTSRDWGDEKWDTRDKPARARFYQNADRRSRRKRKRRRRRQRRMRGRRQGG